MPRITHEQKALDKAKIRAVLARKVNAERAHRANELQYFRRILPLAPNQPLQHNIHH
jgi:hypothetical protein